MVAKADMALKNGSSIKKWKHQARRWKFSTPWIRTGWTQMSSVILTPVSEGLQPLWIRLAFIINLVTFHSLIIWFCATQPLLFFTSYSLMLRSDVKSVAANSPPDLLRELDLRLQLFSPMVTYAQDQIKSISGNFLWSWKHSDPIIKSFSCPPKNPCTPSIFFQLPGVRLQRQQPKQRSPDPPLTEGSHGMLGELAWECVLAGWMYSETLTREASSKHPKQMPELPCLASLDGQEQSLSSELLQSFICLGDHSLSHYPQILQRSSKSSPRGRMSIRILALHPPLQWITCLALCSALPCFYFLKWLLFGHVVTQMFDFSHGRDNWKISWLPKLN